MGAETEEIDMQGWQRIIPFMLQMMVGMLYVKLNPWVPKCITPQGLDRRPGDFKGILARCRAKEGSSCFRSSRSLWAQNCLYEKSHEIATINSRTW
jgi:hypothetical protein